MARITPIDVIKGISGKYGRGRRVIGTGSLIHFSKGHRVTALQEYDKAG